MSILDRLDRLAGGACARAFGEPVALVPRASGRISASVPDPDRPVRTIVAEFHLAPDDVGLMASRREGKSAIGTTAVMAGGAWISITSATAASLGYALREGDMLTLPSRPGPPAWRVTRVDTDDLATVLLTLARVAA